MLFKYIMRNGCFQVVSRKFLNKDGNLKKREKT